MLKALTKEQLALLKKYNLVLSKDVTDETERKALRKARRQRRKLRKAAKASKAAAEQPNARPSDAAVAAHVANGGKVTKVRRGKRVVNRREMKAAMKGDGPKAVGRAA